METLTIWINSNEVMHVANGNKPSRYWLEKPVGLSNLTEITIKPIQLKEWTQKTTKMLLND